MKNNKLIVVLGMHRSGTSAITRGLQVMGVSLGDRLMPPKEGNNTKGFWEDIDLNTLNIEMLSAIDSDWHHLAAIEPNDIEALRKKGYILRAVEMLRQKVGDAPIFAFKDPRVAKLLPFWKEVFSHCQFNMGYVIAVRHPLSVVKSLTKRDGFDAEKNYLLWLGHVITSLSNTAGENRVLVDYDRLIQSSDHELNRIAKYLNLEINPTELRSYKSEFLDQGLRHTTYELNDLLLDDTCPPLVCEVYTALLDVASDKVKFDDIKLQNKVVRWSDEFERLKSSLVLVDRLATQKAIAMQAIAERDGQIANLNLIYNKVVADHEELIANTNQAIANLNQAVTERDGQIANTNQAIAERDGQIASLNLIYNKVVTDHEELIANLNQAVAERDRQIASFNQAAVEHERKIAEFIAQIAQITDASNGHELLASGLDTQLREAQAHIIQAIAERNGQIASFNQAVAEHEGKIAEFIAQIAQITDASNGHELRASDMDTQLQEAQARIIQAITERDEQIANLNLNHNKIVADYEELIASITQAMAGRDGQIGNLNQAMAERDERIASLNLNHNKTVADHDELIASITQAIARCDEQIANLNQAVAERDEQIANLNLKHNKIVADYEELIANITQAVAERDGQIANLNLNHNKVVADHGELIASITQAIAGCDEQIADLNKQLSVLESQVAEKDNILAHRDYEIACHKAHIEEMLNSRSWRITAPLRFVFLILKFLKSKLLTLVKLPLYAVRFARYSIARAKRWHARYGRFPRLTELPALARRAYHEWRKGRVFKGGPAPVYNLNGSTPSVVFTPTGETPPDNVSPQTDTQTTPTPVDRFFDAWVDVNQWNQKREDRLRQRIEAVKDTPLLSVIMPVYNPPVEFLNIAVDSVIKQVYGNWELCIADDASTNGEVRGALKKWAATDKRIKVSYRETNGNISVATNSAASLATGSHLVFLDQDDELTPDALGEIALYIAERPDTDILYSDDDKIDVQGKRFAPQFKPDWSPELLLSYMYFSHVFVVSRQVFNDVGGLRVGFEGSQDYDLALRVSEKARHVGHIPLILYHWRVLPGSTASSALAKPDSLEAGRKAVHEALERRGMQAEAYQPDWAIKVGCGFFSHRFKHRSYPGVTIIIPTKDQVKVLKRCVDSILDKTDYPNYEVLIIDNDSVEQETADYLKKVSAKPSVRVIKISNPDGKFNFAYINNRAAESVASEYVLFLNNDTEVLKKEWLTQMVGYGKIKGVGAVGARLLYPDRRIQHAGVIIKFYCGMAGHAFKGIHELDPGYLGYSKVVRNYSAVTAACLLTPRGLFLEFGGFDEKHFGVAYNDVDYCGRLLDAGYRMVYTPDAELIHHEGYSRGFSDNPIENFNFRDKYYKKKDRYYNRNLSFESEYFEVQPRTAFTGILGKKIKTLMCTHNLNHEGAPYSQYEMTVGLKNKGIIDPIVYSPSDGPLKAMYESHGIEVIIGKNPLNEVLGQNTHPKTEKYREGICEFAGFIKGLGVELVYANTIINFFAIDAARKAGLPSVWNIRESEWETYIDYWGEIAPEAMKCFDYPYKVVFVAYATKHLYAQFNKKHNFLVIYNGLNLERISAEADKYDRAAVRRELGVADGSLMILLPGTVCERKGQHDLALAIGRLGKECLGKIKCFIVGDYETPNPYNSDLHRIIKELPLEAQGCIEVHPISSEIFKYYKAADIFVCTSRIESFPRIILEAMAFSLPIITTPVFGIGEQVQNGVNAEFYTPGDIGGLAWSIDRFVKDDEMRQRFSENSKYVFRNLDNFDDMVDQYAGVFQEAYLSSGDTSMSPVRKICFLTSYMDENSQRYRVYNLIEELAISGIECTVIKTDCADSLASVLDADLLVAFRIISSDNVMRIIDAFKSRGVPVVFDIDDLVFEPQSADLLHGLTSLSAEDKAARIEDMGRLRETLLASDYATCTTDALSKRIESLGKTCFVFPNTINNAQYELAQSILDGKKMRHEGGKVRIGYFSGTRTHEKDFMEASDALYKAMKKNGATEFHIVGILDLDAKFSVFGDRVVRVPLMDHMEMLRYLAGMDINLAPLELDNVFTDCKSELKIFEAALVGVPTVASPTDSYKRCIEDGVNGFLAATEEEWVEKIGSLVRDAGLRKKMAERAKSDFVSRFFIKNVARDIVGIYKNIVSDYKKN